MNKVLYQKLTLRVAYWYGISRGIERDKVLMTKSMKEWLNYNNSATKNTLEPF